MGSCLSSKEFQIEIPSIQVEDCIYEELYHYYYDCSTNNTELQEEITSMNENQSTMKTFQRDSTLMANDIENAAITTKNENVSDSCTNVLDYISIPLLPQQDTDTNNENSFENIYHAMNKSENRKSRNLESTDHGEEERMLFETLYRIPRVMPTKSDENDVCLRTVSDKFFTDNTLNSAVLRRMSECLYSIISVCQYREAHVHWICDRKDSKRNSTNYSLHKHIAKKKMKK
uniref:Uncharacterized protein LOC111111153 isoform X2 n=1 Tax=Crassostrea virginica TaxID=6565 RepID=A0A8B8BK38_CRAVI|nr:uncharacterized protein LOC111111153 isoform X2 [Crassostrea virginica]